MLVAQQVRVDPQDNVWMVDQMSSMVIKFDPNAQFQLLLGRKSESERVPAAALPAAAGGATRTRSRTSRRGRPTATSSTVPPTSRGMPPATFISPTASATHASPSSTSTASSSSPGARAAATTGQFNTPHGIAIDAQGNVYVADTGNKRIQVFDGDGNFKPRSPTLARRRRCASRPVRTRCSTAPIPIRRTISIRPAKSTSWSWTGKSSGKFGKAGKLPKEFGTVNAIDCRSENEL